MQLTESLSPFHVKLVLLLGIALLIPVVWSFMGPSAGEIRHFLPQMAHLAHTHPLEGCLIFEVLLFLAVVLGVPLTMVFMLLAGVLYDFWPALTLVTAARMAGAIACFLIARLSIFGGEEEPAELPHGLNKIVRHDGYMYLLVLRLLPVVPDTIVSYGVGATPLKWHTYLWVTFVGMIPLTLLCVWAGSQFGSLPALWRYLY